MGKEQLGNMVGDPFLVKGRTPGLPAVLAAVGVAVCIIAGIVAIVSDDDRMVAGGVSAVGALVAATGVALVISKRSLWHICLFENGAQVKTKAGTQTEILFEELAAISHQPKPHYANGVYAGVRHILQLWRKQDSPKQPFAEIDCYIKEKKNQGEAEAMQALADMASGTIGERLEKVVEGGGRVKSPGGLQLDAHSLHYGGKSLALDDIVETGVFDGKFCVWQKGDDFASLKLNPAEANILPIMAIVARHLAKREEQQGEPQGGGLGRILFERRQSKVLGWILLVIAIPLVLALVGIPLIYFARGLIRGYFRCHERGVSRRFAGKETSLLYTQVASFVYSATRMYYNGAYTGTSLVMNFMTEDPRKTPPIKYSTSVRNVDEDLDELREQIAAVVAQRLLRAYAETNTFEWTKELHVTADGFRYRKPKLIGKGEWQTMSFADYQGFDIQEGTFHLFAKDGEKSVFHCSISEPNFFPGLHALAAIIEPESDEELEPEPAVEPSR
jgi:hypothetical protein